MRLGTVTALEATARLVLFAPESVGLKVTLTVQLVPALRVGVRLGQLPAVTISFNLKPGVALPRVSLPATTGAEFCLAEVPGRSVLIIYPWTGRPGHPNPPNWDDIPGAHGSTPELEGFRDLSARENETIILAMTAFLQIGIPFPKASKVTAADLLGWRPA